MKKFTVLFILISVFGFTFSASAFTHHGAVVRKPITVDHPLHTPEFDIEVLVPDQVVSIEAHRIRDDKTAYNPGLVFKTAIKEIGKDYNIKNGIAIGEGIITTFGGYVYGGATRTLILFVEPKKKN